MELVAIPNDGGRHLAQFGRAQTMTIFAVDNGTVIGREDRPNPDPEHLDPAHHRVMLDLVRGCDVVIAGHIGSPMIGSPMIVSLRRLGVRVLGAPSEGVEESLESYCRSQQGGPALEALAGNEQTRWTQ